MLASSRKDRWPTPATHRALLCSAAAAASATAAAAAAATAAACSPSALQVNAPVTGHEEVHAPGTVNVWTGRVLKEYRKPREGRGAKQVMWTPVAGGPMLRLRLCCAVGPQLPSTAIEARRKLRLFHSYHHAIP